MRCRLVWNHAQQQFELRDLEAVEAVMIDPRGAYPPRPRQPMLRGFITAETLTQTTLGLALLADFLKDFVLVYAPQESS